MEPKDDYPTALEMAKAYPNAFLAIAWCEAFLFAPDDTGASGWQMLTNPSNGRSNPEQIRRTIADVLDEEIAEGFTNERIAKAREQMEGAEFVRYLAGKMGAM